MDALEKELREIETKVNTMKILHDSAPIPGLTKRVETLLRFYTDHLNRLSLMSQKLEEMIDYDEHFLKRYDSDFIYSLKNGLLSCKSRTKKDTPKKEVKQVKIPELNYNMKFTITNNIQEIPPAIWYYGGSKYNKGFYICLVAGVYVQIPFPEVVESSNTFRKNNTIRCIHGTYENCSARKAFKKTYTPCSYSHVGEKIHKVGHNFRCQKIITFGNKSTLLNDVHSLEENDVRQVLLYGLNDLMAATIWADKTKFNTSLQVMCDIDVG